MLLVILVYFVVDHSVNTSTNQERDTKIGLITVGDVEHNDKGLV